MMEWTVAGADDDDFVLHVVRVTVVGLTGIMVDSSTELKLGENREHPAPPLQMKAVLAVLRDSESHISALSERLVKMNVNGENGKTSRYKRLIAVWRDDNKSNENASVAFETKLLAGSRSTQHAPHQNVELVVGLTPGNSSTATPIGTASLPISEAAQFRGSNGKVVLDLPVHNFASLPVDPFTKPTNEKVIPLTKTTSSRRKRHSHNHANAAAPRFDQRKKKKALGYDYCIDPDPDAAILRVELEFHEKELNVEVEWGAETEQRAKGRNVVLYTQAAKNVGHPTRINSIHYMEPSIERVLSAESEIEKLATQEPSHDRRFRIKVVDHTSMDCQWTAMQPKYVGSSVNADLSESTDDAKIRIMDAAIERVLSAHISKLVDEESICEEPMNSAFTTPTRSPFLKAGSPDSAKSAGFSRTPAPSISRSPKNLARRSGPFGLLWRLGKPHAGEGIKSKISSTVLAGGDGVVALHEFSQSPPVSQSGTSCSNSPSSTRETKAASTRQASARRGKKWGLLRQPLCQKAPISSVSSTSAEQHFGISVLPSSAASTSSPCRLSDLAVDVPVSVEFKATKLPELSRGESVALSSSEVHLVASSDGKKESEDEWKEEAVVVHLPERERTAEKLSLGFTRASPESAYLSQQSSLSAAEGFLTERDDDDNIVEEETFQAVHTVVLDRAEVQIVPSSIKQKLIGMMDLEPCAGKLENLLVVDDDDFSGCESWSQNDNSTLNVSLTRKEAFLRDDLADLGLLMGEFCRQSGFRLRDDLSEGGTVQYREKGKETIVRKLFGEKSRLVLGFDVPVLRTFASKQRVIESMSWAEATNEEDYDENASASSSSSSGDSDSTDEQIILHEEAVANDEGTEVDVKDVILASKGVSAFLAPTSEVEKEKSSVKTAPSTSSESRSGGSRSHSKSDVSAMRSKLSSTSILGLSAKNYVVSLRGNPSFAKSARVNSASAATVSIRSKEAPVSTNGAENSIPTAKRSRKVSDTATIEKPPGPSIPLPPLANRVTVPQSPLRQHAWVGRTGRSNPIAENLSPSDVMIHPTTAVPPDSKLKSFAKSLADMVEYAITPIPAVSPPAPSPIPLIPSTLEAFETSSVGDLTANTYEMSVDVEDFKRQLEQCKRLTAAWPGASRSYDVAANDNYFAEYCDQSSLTGGPARTAAAEAAAAKQLAENWATGRQSR